MILVSLFLVLLYENNIISRATTPTCVAIRLHFYLIFFLVSHFYLIWEAATINGWLYNGGPYELIVLWAHLLQLLQHLLLFKQ
jgi:hypothetical protein